ncbi:5-methylcytosine-specific restriction endonuclease McrA [Streptomyces griseochromogenes]|uniref:5-methylcytosine-specific restriction endonuclease McrA n=1 Tax=Streptomyces griseochromogenes TaxID=68214 RepID=A0ABS4LYN2_9ACTN|nr:HNH endonuclease signature motif containing protein [Streptomyces griseochromogenes]MBP2052514.1 5-methylcytosine-specific restriction endonuclease McrA [Streptomyces griseochromogenes]
MAIYHDMKVYENFERSARRIFECVQDAQRRSPGARRYLYLDVQGHRNEAGGYDHDAFELMQEFTLGFLGDYLTEIHTPLCHARNPKRQRNDLPDVLRIHYPDDGSDYGYNASALPVKPRERHPADRKSPPTVKAIANYLGLEDPACLVCWRKPVERAHVVPIQLGGSMDVRNFALLCPAHHAEAPDVADAESFWAWVDYAELRDSPDKWLDAPDELKGRLQDLGVAIGVGEREPLTFFSAVKHELKALYGWTDGDFTVTDWAALMDEFHKVLEQATGRHFAVEKKVSTHAWAYHMARRRLNGTE